MVFVSEIKGYLLSDSKLAGEKFTLELESMLEE